MTIAIYDIQAILVNGVMKAVGSGKICKTKVEEIWQHYKKNILICVFLEDQVILESLTKHLH